MLEFNMLTPKMQTTFFFFSKKKKTKDLSSEITVWNSIKSSQLIAISHLLSCMLDIELLHILSVKSSLKTQKPVSIVKI